MTTPDELNRRLEELEGEPKKYLYGLLTFAGTMLLAIAAVLLTTQLRSSDSIGFIALLFSAASLCVGGFARWCRRDHDYFRIFTDALPLLASADIMQSPDAKLDDAIAFVKEAQPKFDKCNRGANQSLNDIIDVQAGLAVLALILVVVWVATRVFAG